MNAIILAAGIGKRLGKITKKIPKCLVTVGETTILKKILQNLQILGVKNVKIVIGYLGEIIRASFGNEYLNMKIDYIENPMFYCSGTGYSLWKGLTEKISDERLLIIEGDVYFEPELVLDFPFENIANCTFVEKYRPELEGTFVSLDKHDYISEWLHKDMRDPTKNLDRMYKTINIHKFNSDFVKTMLIPTINKCIDEYGINISLEKILHEIVGLNNKKILALKNYQRKWVEIDDQSDLEKANSIFTKFNFLKEYVV